MAHQPMRRQRRTGRTHIFHLRGCVRNHLGILAAREGAQPVRSGWGILIEDMLFMRLGPQITTSQFDGCFGSLHVSKAATSAQSNLLRRTSADTMVHSTAPRLRGDRQCKGQKRQMRRTEQHNHSRNLQYDGDLSLVMTIHMPDTKSLW
jgi:hypothetical protein